MSNFTLGDLSPAGGADSADLLLLRSGGQDYKLPISALAADLLADSGGAGNVGIEPAGALSGTVQSALAAVEAQLSLPAYSRQNPSVITSYVTDPVAALDAYNAYGSRFLPMGAFQPGARLAITAPLQYNLSGDNSVTIAIVFQDFFGGNGGDATLFTQTFFQEQDSDVLRVDLTAQTGSSPASVIYTGYANWGSNLDGFTAAIPVSDYDAVEFTGSFAFNVTAQFALDNGTDSVTFQDIQLQYFPPPADLATLYPL